MNCLLDTHVFLWAAFEPKRLSRSAHQAITDSDNTIFVSGVSFWEISLKFSLGKIEFKGVSPDELPDTALRMGLNILELHAEDAASFHSLPRGEHKDPFDRMLAYQAIRQHKTLVSADSELACYIPNGLKLLW